MGSVDWLTVAVSLIVALTPTILNIRSQARRNKSAASLDEAQAAEIVQRVAGVQLKEMADKIEEQSRTIKSLEADRTSQERVLDQMRTDMQTERDHRRELERGVGILVNQLTVAGIKPSWTPPAYELRRKTDYVAVKKRKRK